MPLSWDPRIEQTRRDSRGTCSVRAFGPALPGTAVPSDHRFPGSVQGRAESSSTSPSARRRRSPTRAQEGEMFRSIASTIAICFAVSGGALAQKLPKGVVIVTPDKATWGSSSTPGAKAGITQQALLVGNPSKLGAYVYQNKFPP